MSKRKHIYLSPPHLSGLELEFIKDALDSNWIAPLGPHVEAFEREIAEYVGAKSALAVCSGTAAIHLALIVLGVKRGDVVFCSSLTFIGSVNPILYQGAKPVFIDSEPESWNMSAEALKRAFKDFEKKRKLPKAVIVVHIYGQSADMDAIKEICDFYEIPIVEDAAEALGTTYKGKFCGTIGKFGIYSFNGNKIITTSGGGMLVSDEEETIKKAKFFATQAREPVVHYEHKEIGYNYRLSNILAAIGRAQLRVLEERIERKRQIFKKYQKALGDIEGINFMPEVPYGRSTYWLTVMTIDPKIHKVTPNDLVKALADENIEARPVWKPMHMQPVFKNCVFYPHSNNEVVSEKLFRTGVCLPSGSSMLEEDQERVIKCIRKILTRA